MESPQNDRCDSSSMKILELIKPCDTPLQAADSHEHSYTPSIKNITSTAIISSNDQANQHINNDSPIAYRTIDLCSIHSLDKTEPSSIQQNNKTSYIQAPSTFNMNNGNQQNVTPFINKMIDKRLAHNNESPMEDCSEEHQIDQGKIKNKELENDSLDKPHQFIEFENKAEARKILAHKEKTCEPSEYSESKHALISKKMHFSYKKKSLRDEVTKKFFSFDWYADSLSKYSVESGLTSEVYWHYIGSQYFPSDFINTLKYPHEGFDKMKSKLEGCLIQSLRPLSHLELDAFSNMCLLQQPETLSKEYDLLENQKKMLTTDKLISELESQLSDYKQSVKQATDALCEKMHTSYADAKDQECFPDWFSGNLNKLDSKIYTEYTKRAIKDFESINPDSDDILQEIAYPDHIESQYFDAMEKKHLAATLAAEAEAKKSGNRKKGRSKLSNSENQENMNSQTEDEAKRMALKRQSSSNNSCQHRINQYLQDAKLQVKKVDDTVCQICNDGDYEDKNMIVFCAKCNISVHQKCYGIDELPTGDWICDMCKEFGPKYGKVLSCPLCSIRGGAMKATLTRITDLPTYNKSPVSPIKKPQNVQHNNEQVQQNESSSTCSPAHKDLVYDFKQEFTEEELANEPKPTVAWVHLSCAYWMPELELWTKDMSYPISGLEQIDQRRFKLVCNICKQRGVGCCIQCNKGKCQAAFHVECARLAGVYMEFEARKEEPTANSAFCDKHRPLKLRKDIEQSRKKSADDILSFCKVVDKCLTAIEKIGDEKYKENKGKVKKPVIPNKIFNKIEKKKLISRMRFICKKWGNLTININKTKLNENPDSSIKYKVGPCVERILYQGTVSKTFFPWNDVKVSNKFTALNCYHKYISLIPDDETFKRKILQLDDEKIEKEQKELKKAHRKVKKEPVKEIPIISSDNQKYCSCKRTPMEFDCQMIGIFFKN